MKKILVPTDFSECALAASKFAMELSQLAKSDLHFLHLMKTPVDWVKLPKEKEKNFPEVLKNIRESKNLLNDLIHRSSLLGVSATQFLAFDSRIENIIGHIDDHHHDLVVMGSHGSQGLKDKIFGSTSQRVLRNAKVPVLIIKKEIEEPIKKIAFISEFSEINRATIEYSFAFAQLFSADIELVSINKLENDDEKKRIEKEMDRVITYHTQNNKINKKIINKPDIRLGSMDHIKGSKPDLICMITHGKSGLMQLFAPSVSEKIASDIQLPILGLPLL
ncbi:MAG: universal stress protein [Flavobacteriales bacterium]|nr:universal stress protein [Flavobacteriales bacterium]